MIAAEKLAPRISDLLTWDQICLLYPDQWVCLVEMEFVPPRHPHPRRARVIGHGKTRQEPFDHARRWHERYEHIGHLHTGRVLGSRLLGPRISEDSAPSSFEVTVDHED